MTRLGDPHVSPGGSGCRPSLPVARWTPPARVTASGYGLAVYLPVHAWLAAFLLTIAVEVPIVALLLRGRDPGGPRLAVLVVFASLATHPAVWFIVPQLFLVGTLMFTLAAETWAVAAEAIFYATASRGLSPLRAIGTSLVANGASYVVGVLVSDAFPDLFR